MKDRRFHPGRLASHGYLAVAVLMGLSLGLWPDALSHPAGRFVSSWLSIDQRTGPHCVAAAFPIAPTGERLVVEPARPVAECFDTFEEAMRSIGADPNDYRPIR